VATRINSFAIDANPIQGNKGRSPSAILFWFPQLQAFTCTRGSDKGRRLTFNLIQKKK